MNSKIKIGLFSLFFCFFYFSFAEDSIITTSASNSEDTVLVQKHKILKKYPPHFDSLENRFVLRNEMAPYGRKVLRGMGLSFASQGMSTALLLVVPADFSNWKVHSYRENFKNAYTKPPVIDHDVWYINYIGHPYQGSWYYNAYRSQGAKWWQSALFSFGHSTFWEYLIESGFERPSVQDLIVTPVIGSLLGELFHFSTMKMSKNGFKWYEATFVSLFNPMFAINNGFKRFNVQSKKNIAY
ncbi:MAG TPA: DUF3943 domain-containing protein [Chitinophagales bacterium]|nr:DUF3943 domain-containing protein [Chitinophagales bacterium]